MFGPVQSGIKFNYDALKGGLGYTVNCLKEALRKYAIVPVVTRQALNDDTLGPYNIPASTRVILPPPLRPCASHIQLTKLCHITRS